jgi:glycosyltransferase involved in cell wall biosynthesis
LIPPADAASLADRIGYILGDTARTERMRGRARDYVAARYSIENTATRYQNLFEEVMAA